MKPNSYLLSSLMFLAAISAAGHRGAQAAALQASPVLVELQANSPSATVQIRNTVRRRSMFRPGFTAGRRPRGRNRSMIPKN